MLTVLTVCNKMDPIHVWHLKRGVERHLHVPHRFVCLTDILTSPWTSEGIEYLPLKHKWPRHFAKAEMWRPDLERFGRILYLDLSCVIQGDMAPLLEYEGDFCVVSDFYWQTACQSVVSFTPGAGRAYYDAMVENAEVLVAAGSSKAAPDFHDQVLMNIVDRGGPIDTWPAGVVTSYKIQGPHDAPVVKFHGTPKPEDTEWARKIWKTNAGFPLLPYVPLDFPSEDIRKCLHIEQAEKTGDSEAKPGLQKVRLVLDESPDIDEVMREKSALLVAVDGGIQILNQHGIVPDVGIVVMGEKGECKEHWITSKHPQAVEADKIFHAALTQDELRQGRLHYLSEALKKGEGTWFMMITPGGNFAPPIVHALSLLRTKGYRLFTIHGFRCDTGEGVEVPILGETFTCSAKEYSAARQFSEFLLAYGRGVGIRVRGGGLISKFIDMNERLGVYADNRGVQEAQRATA